MSKEHNHPFDRLGITVSVICAIHCILGPVLLAIAPWMSSAFGHELFHLLTLIIVVPIAWIALYRNHSIHKNKLPIILGTIGITFLVAGILIPELIHHEHHHGENLERTLTTIGSLVLVVAHIINIKNCRKCAHHHHDH